MLYCDSSVAVALLLNEPHSARADDSWATRRGEVLALSRWVETEVAAALSAKMRSGLDTGLLDEARARFAELIRSSHRLPIEARHFDLATRFASVSGALLRGGDALHLAIAFEAGATLCTFDRRQAGAAALLNVPCELI
ncbi:MAG: uncharacterized protein QOI38_2749 [Sphingomonadales bacterium]|jgi:predicted nucleic acid-binding protein|nr:uncharacterized protein [Sphingomonadales bacterium]